MPIQPARRAAALFLLTSGAAALAQTAAPPAPKKTEAKAVDTPVVRVEVKGSADAYDPRRDDTASKTVLHSEEILKYGDSNVYDVLKRAPGVTVVGNAIRMRGLGGGYTQILVNGDRAPPGFSLDTLTPDQIEKIEIMRAPTAENSMQAIAGTINIVLHRVVAKAQRDLRLMANHSRASDFRLLGGTLADKTGSLSYFLYANLIANRNRNRSLSSDEFTAPSGTLTKARASVSSSHGSADTLILAPRLNWKMPNGDDLNIQATLQAGRQDQGYTNHTEVQTGEFVNPQYVDSVGATPGRRGMAGGDINWIAKLGGGKLDLKVNGYASHNTSDSGSTAYTLHRQGSLVRQWDSSTASRQGGMNLKFSRPLLEGHSLSSGVEMNRQRTEEQRERMDLLDGGPPHTIVERFIPELTRLAGYVQDEWDVTGQWSMYLGARWESVGTDSGTTSTEAPAQQSRSRAQVLSPVAQTLYRFPDKSGRQLRLALTRTFKAPTTDELTARRFESSVNTQFSPDYGGNPALRPELAKGIDLTYEHFWFPGAVFSVGASARNISDYIRRRLGQDAAGRWVYQPLNAGNAQVRSLETELKFPLKAIYEDAPAFDFRLSFNRNWSRVDAIPGPSNRLDAQTPRSATAGFDYRLGTVSTGATVAYRRGGWVRMSVQESQLLESRTDIDTYFLWKPDARHSLRLSLGNLAREGFRRDSYYTDANGTLANRSRNEGYVQLGANLEIKL